MISPLSLNFWWISLIRGAESRAEGDQLAQNSTRYAVPSANFETGSPFSHFPVWSGGAESPTFSVAPTAASGTTKIKITNPKIRECDRCRICIIQSEFEGQPIPR